MLVNVDVTSLGDVVTGLVVGLWVVKVEADDVGPLVVVDGALLDVDGTLLLLGAWLVGDSPA